MTAQVKRLSISSGPSSPSSLSSLRSKLSSRSSSSTSEFPPLTPSAGPDPAKHLPRLDYTSETSHLLRCKLRIPPEGYSGLGPFGGEEESEANTAEAGTGASSVRGKGNGKSNRERDEGLGEVLPAVQLEEKKLGPINLDQLPPPSPVIRSRTDKGAWRQKKSVPRFEVGSPQYSIVTLMERLPFEEMLSSKLLAIQIKEAERERQTQLVVPAEVPGWSKPKKRPQARRENSEVKEKKEVNRGNKATEWVPLSPQLYVTFAQLYEDDFEYRGI